MTNERLKEIERSLAATTPGEWRSSGTSFGTPWIASDDTTPANMVCNPPDSYYEDSIETYWEPNAAFIIAAHNSYIPELLAEVRRLREQEKNHAATSAAARQALFYQLALDGKPCP